MTDQISRLFRSLPDNADPRLRIGVLLDGFELPQVFRGVLEDICASDFALVTLLVFNNEQPGQPPAARGLARYVRTVIDAHRRRHALFSAYEALLEPRFAIENDPLAPVDCHDLLDPVPALHVVPERRGFVHRFPPEAIEHLRSERLDVLLRFGFGVLRGEILSVARYGVWSYHHGDNEFYRGLPPAFWEMAEGNPVTGAILQRLTEELDGGLVLVKGSFMTDSVLSVTRNRYGPYWGSRHFVIQKLQELRRGSWDELLARAVSPARRPRKLYRRPTNIEVVRWGLRRVLPHAWRRFRERKLARTWEIGLRDSARALYEPESDAREPPFTFNAGPAGHFWADPCLSEHEGIRYVFFEDYNAGTRRGAIAVARVDDSGHMLESRTVLERPYHLSYPLVFCHNAQWYMIPESASAGVIELYRSIRFPDGWQRVQTLLDIAGLDSTVFEYEGRWWMFTTPDIGRNHAAITLLFCADDLHGPWRHHPQSPISTDVRVARSAGPIIRVGTRLLRVSQNCAGGYGRNIVFSEVLEITSERYRERRLSEVFAPRSADIGMHTYGRLGTWETIDTNHLAAKIRTRPAP
jgi:hypothetical protein